LTFINQGGISLTKEKAMKMFEEKNKIKIIDFGSDRRVCTNTGLKFDQYIGYDNFDKNINAWLDDFEEEEKEVILKLLANYTYVPESIYGGYLDDLLDQIILKCNMDEAILNSTYFITFPSSKGVKSGGDIIRAELPLGHLDTISKDQLISNVEMNIKNIKSSAKCIVFIDDIVGTGKTAMKNVEKGLKDLGEIKNVKVILAAMYAQEDVISNIKEQLKEKKHNIEFVLLNKCEKCMKEQYIFDAEELKSNYPIISKYEEKVAGKKIGIKGSNAMGYENAQFLLSFYYNTPNNTLCIFWKPTETNYPPFLRTSFKRPNIDDIVKNRKNRKENAYEARKLFRTKHEGNIDIVLS